MSKSRDAFRTISEVADWLETPAHVLRFWESKFTQVKPVKRAGGRRYYRPADMLLLGGIKKLLHDDGLTIKGAQKLLREHGVKHVSSLSQPLEEDIIEEAGFVDVPEAPAEPKEPAQVLNFRPREEAADAPVEAEAQKKAEAETTGALEAEEPTETMASVADAPEDVPTLEQEPEETSEARVVDVRKPEPPIAAETEEIAADEAEASKTEAPEPEPVEPEPDVASTAQSAAEDETPPAGFGGDTLPAFLRRGPEKPPEDTSEPAEDAATAEPKTPSKVTIDPIARFVHTPSASELEKESAAAEPETQPETIETEEAAEAPAPAAASSAESKPIGETPQEPKPEETPARPVLMADVPPAAKIAPELNSYSSEGGVLSKLAGASKISTDLADELTPHLAELRALRDRMASAGRG